MRLYGYFRSSAVYRVRIALHLKELDVEYTPVDLRAEDGGEHRRPEFLSRNPQGAVPVLELDDGTLLTQSLAIIEYLDAIAPTTRLIPEDPVLAAKVRAVALTIACDTHPLNNLRVHRYLQSEFGFDEAAVERWNHHWLLKGGLEGVEQMIEPGPFCFGAAPTLADACLVPQVYNARRFNAPINHLPKVVTVDAVCVALSAFQAAHPSQQSDAV